MEKTAFKSVCEVECEKSFKRKKEKVIIDLYFNTKTVETTLVGFALIILSPPLYIAEVCQV